MSHYPNIRSSPPSTCWISLSTQRMREFDAHERESYRSQPKSSTMIALIGRVYRRRNADEEKYVGVYWNNIGAKSLRNERQMNQ